MVATVRGKMWRVEQVTVGRIEQAAKSYLDTSSASAVIVCVQADRLMIDLKNWGQ